MAKTDPFASYQMPLGLAEGVNIPLLGTDAVFKVRLPATMNEDFNVALMAELNMTPDEDGKVRVNSGKFQTARKKLFFQDCILEASGLPDGMTHQEFFAEYGLAARAIFERASTLAIEADEQANECLGKYETTPVGNPSGEEEQNNTTKLSKVG